MPNFTSAEHNKNTFFNFHTLIYNVCVQKGAFKKLPLKAPISPIRDSFEAVSWFSLLGLEVKVLTY